MSATGLAAPVLAFLAGALGTSGALLLAGPVALRLARTPVRPRTRGARWLRLLAAAGRHMRPRGAAAPAGLDARLAAAGRPGGLGARELLAAKLAAAAVGALAGLVLAPAAPGRLGPLLAGAGPVCGFLAPDLWLARRAAERVRRVRRELPALLELLRVAVEAGAALPAALAQVGERAEGVLAGGWQGLGRELALGVPLTEALERFEIRFPQPEVRALAAALERAGRHGSPLGETLGAQAGDARAALARHAREQAARAGPQIQLVVALLLVPSVLLLVAAALVNALLGSGDALLPV